MADDPVKARIEFLKARLLADTRELIALEAAVEERARLQKRHQGGNTQEAMVAAERLRVSQGKRGDTPLRDAVNTAGLTMRSLAEQLKAEGFEVTHSLLSQAQAGKRSISERLARRVEALTGFPATKKSWPKLRVGE